MLLIFFQSFDFKIVGLLKAYLNFYFFVFP